MICYVSAIIVLALGAVPIFRFWQQTLSERADYQQVAYFDYNKLLAISVMLVGVLVSAVFFWIARRFTKP